MDEIYEYNGKQFTLAQLQDKYGDKVNDAITKFGFKKVETQAKEETANEETFTYKDKTFTRSELQEKYGDKTDEAISKFGFESNLKKKDESELTSSDTNLASKETTENGSLGTQDYNGQLVKDIDEGKYDNRIDELQAENQKLEKRQKEKEKNQSVSKEMFRSFQKGSSRLGEMVAAIPELVYDVFAIPQNAISDKFDIESLSASSESFKDYVGLENVVKDYYADKVEAITKEQIEKDKFIVGDITSNIKQGNISDAFRLIGKSVSESLPSTIGIAISGGSASAPQILTGVTTVFGAGENEAYKKENPNMNNNERTVKALGKGLAEGVFSSIGSSKIGVAAKEIILKEGKEEGAKILKTQLVNMYKELLKKYPIPSAMIGEGIEEAATQMTQNAIDGKPIMEGVSDSFIVGSASGGGFGIALEGVKKLSKDKITPKDIENVEATLEKEESIKNELQQQVKEGDLKPTEAKDIYDNWEEIKSNLQAVPEEFTPEQKAKSVEIIKEKKKLEKEIEGKEPALVEDKKAKIEELNNELKNIKNTYAKSEETTQEAEKQQVETPTSETETESEKPVVVSKEKSNLTSELYDYVRTEEFKKWFGDWENTPSKASKAVDENGEPLIFYRGDANFKDKTIDEIEPESGLIFLTPDKEYAEMMDVSKENTKGFFANIRNPELIDMRESYKTGAKDDINTLLENQDGKFIDVTNLRNNPSKYDKFHEIAVRSKSGSLKEAIFKKSTNETAYLNKSKANKERLDESIKEVNETTPTKDTTVNGDLQPSIEPSTQQGQDNQVSPTVESATSEGEAEVSDVDYALSEIDKGVTLWDGNPYSQRVNLEMTRADIRKGEADLKKGKFNTVPAKRLVEAIKNAKDKGGYEFIEGSGGNINKTFVPLTQDIVSDTELNPEETNLLNTQKEELSNEYDGWFDTLDETAQNEILEDYEYQENNSREVSPDAERGESQENVVDEKTTEPSEQKPEVKAQSFRDKIIKIPNSGIFGKYLSGETIEREHVGELNNNQDIEVQILGQLGNHGIETIELAKNIFGTKYIEKTLEQLEDSSLKSHEKAVIYVSLENEMNNRVKYNPDSVGDKKLQDLVRSKSQKHLREASLSINAGRLRAYMRDGYITDPITNKMYSKEQLEGKKKIEKAIESNMDAINNEAEALENDLDFEIKKPKIIRNKTVVKKEINETLKKLRADLLRAAKGDVALSSIPYAAQLKVATPHIIKLSKLLAELGSMNTNEIIKEIHDNLKDVFNKIKKSDIENVLKEVNTPKPRKKVNQKQKLAKQLVKEALIEKGFSRDINVKINKKDVYGKILKDKDGRNIKAKERRTILDWKKLAGESGSIENIKENVESVLKSKGYSETDIENMSNELIIEYNNLRASVIEKSLNELNRRNEIRKRVDVKSTAKRLAELFNYGLFDKEADTYNNLINSALGFNDLDNKSFKEIEVLAKTLSDLYNQDVSEIGLQSSIAYVNKEIARTLSNAAFLQSNTPFKIVSIVSEYINLSTRFLLVRMSQLIENPFSGYVQRNYSKIAYALEKTDNKALSSQRVKISKERFKSIVRDGGNSYGDTSSLLINDSKIENWLNKKTENELNHAIISLYMGRAFLEGFDSRHKTVLTEKYFTHNLVKVLSHPSNPNKMSKTDALNFVTDKLTGESFENAKKKARAITEKTNKDAGRKILSEKERSINIFAQDIMKDTLLEGEILTEDQIASSYKSAYKAAGKDIGHVANNPVSKMVGLLNANVEKQLQESIKEKDWNKAALYTTIQMFTRNILNTFVGGGTNWVVLGLQKSGIYGLPSLIYTRVEKGNKKIDLTSVQGMKNLENILYQDLNYKNTAARVVLGSALALITASIAISSGADDDIDEWLKKNEWAKRYFDKLAPEILIAILAYKNEDMGKYFKKVFNSKSQAFDVNTASAKSITDLFSEKENKGAELGEFLGSKVSFPAPYKLTKDIKDIYRFSTGEPVIKPSYKSSGFWNGFFQGGLIEHIGLRPGENQEIKELQEKIDNVYKPVSIKRQENRENKPSIIKTPALIKKQNKLEEREKRLNELE